MIKTFSQLKAVMILPFNVLVTVPILILYLTRETNVFGITHYPIFLVAGLFLIGMGISALFKTIRLFSRQGKGTLAPWDPTKHLIITGPYRYVRNPMISGVLTALLGEAMFFGSWILGAFAGFFFMLNTLYFKFSEEPGLVKRFGKEYEEYRKQVPMWIPRRTPYESKSKVY